MRFRIRWRDGAYFVTVPEYEGGVVVTADDFDRVHGALDELYDATHDDDGSDCDHARLLDAMERARVTLDDFDEPRKPWQASAGFDGTTEPF